jgi:hypothetical protein
MKRLIITTALLVTLVAAPSAWGQVRGVPLFANPSSGPGQPTANGWVWTGMPTQPQGPGYGLFSSHPLTSGAGIPSAAGGTNNFTTQIPGSVFRGTVFLPSNLSFR